MNNISKKSQMLASLPTRFRPVITSLHINPDLDKNIKAAERELTEFANKDQNKCWGYFPALAEKNHGLTAARTFQQSLPFIELMNKKMELNFLRISLIQQTGKSPYHMDSDSDTALTGDVSTIPSRLVWRFLVNLSSRHSRKLGYLNLDTTKIKLTTEGGYIHYTDSAEAYESSVILPPRTEEKLHGVLFCASRVLHTGKDDTHGHFVAGYGCEESIV